MYQLELDLLNARDSLHSRAGTSAELPTTSRVSRTNNAIHIPSRPMILLFRFPSVIPSLARAPPTDEQVQPEQQQDGSVVYSASNPDEGALIYAASHFGHRFLRRDGKDIAVAVTTRHEQPLASQPTSTPTSSGSSNSARGGRCGSTSLSMQQQNARGGVKISSMSPPPPLSPGGGADVCGGSPVVGGEEEEAEENIFHILHTFPFTSDRKRSSVVVRKGTGGVVVYCKGADNVILERLDLAKNPAELVKTVKENIAEFTRDGECLLGISA